MIRFSTLMLLFCLPDLLQAQQSQLVFEHYGKQEGFNSRSCRTVVKTSDGMIWLTTDDGLIRYDSKKFRYYQHSTTDTNSLASNFTDQMVVDSKNRLWIVSGAGLDVFDPYSESFSHCIIREDGKSKRDFSPESLYYDRELDRIWIGTHLGLYYCPASSRILRKAKTDASSREWIDLTFIDIKKDKKGLLWLCNEFGFFSYNIGNGHLTQYHVPEQSNEIANDDGAFCLFPEDSIIWIGTWNKGLVKFNIVTGKGKHYYYGDNKKVQNGITFIIKTGRSSEQHLLWLSTPNSGLGTFDTNTGKFSFYNTDNENDKNGIKGITNRMLPTSSEGMWIASENGLHRYDYSQQLFRFIDLKAVDKDFVNALPLEFLNFQTATDGSDSLCWFHVPYKGPYCYNLKTGKMADVPSGFKKIFNTSIFNFYLDRKKILWVSTDKHGVIGYNLNTHKIHLLDKPYFSAPWEWATDFLEDSNGTVWIATYKGLYSLDHKRQKVKADLPLNSELQKRGIGLRVTAMAEDYRGRLWLIISGNNDANDAIVLYDVVKREITVFDNNNTKSLPPGLKLNKISCSGNNIMVATSSGLLYFNGNDEKPQYKLLNTQHGLINNYLSDIITDKNGNVWCSTVFGVSCFLPDRNFFINYSYTTTALGYQKNPSLFLSRNSGKIYLNQQGGFNEVNPDEIEVQQKPRILFTELKVFNKPFWPKKRQIQSGDVVRLNYNQNMISVEFSGMSFSNSEDNLYAYYLKGLEDEWNISKNNLVAYTNLSPGKYTLLVKASNSSGVWVSQPSAITIIIDPPFWKTWWFILSVIIFIFLGLYFLYRYRINQLLHIQHIRNSISRNLHDEIGSTLTSINILSNVSRQVLDKDPLQVKYMLDKIAVQSKSIQQNMSDIVWAIRSDNDRVENLLVRIREYTAQTLEPLNIETEMNVDEVLLNKTLSIEKRKEILLICKEALNNVAKHSGATKVIVVLNNIGHNLILEIKDNGSWKGNSTNSGTGINSIKQRAALVNGKVNFYFNEEGTTVAISIPIT